MNQQPVALEQDLQEVRRILASRLHGRANLALWFLCTRKGNGVVMPTTLPLALCHTDTRNQSLSGTRFMRANTISSMTQEEKLETMEALWDLLAHDECGLPSPDWHGEVLASRQSKLVSGNATFVSLDDLKAEHKR